MEIEKTTPPGYFRNNYHKSAVNILYTCNWVQERVKMILNGEDITPQQYNILQILKHNDGPLSTLNIRQRMLDKMSDASRIVDRLLKKELVDKKISLADRRLVDVTINKNGMALLDRVAEKNDEIDAVLSNISEQEAATLNRLLDKIREKN